MARREKRRKKGRGGSGGGRLSGMRLGLKGLVGTGGRAQKKESLLSKVVTYVLLAAAIAVLIWKFFLR